MAIRVGINGFGRIGRQVVRAAKEARVNDLDFVAVNDITDTKTLAHLFKYDSVHRTYRGRVEAGANSICIDGDDIQVLSEKDPAALPWKELGVDVVLESTGRFTKAEDARKHVTAGAKKVIISAPAKGEDVTIVMGVNHEKYDPGKHAIISNASCTTNCLASMAKVLMDSFGVERGLMTTIHSYTNDQRILDLPHEDLRRARAAALSMIPSSTGAAKMIGEVIPELKGKLNGTSIRVPTPNVSIVDLTAELSRKTSVDEINAAFKSAAEGKLKGIVQYNTEPTVSVDYNGNPASCIFDATQTAVADDGKFIKVFGWYDNEWGFSNRMVDVSLMIGGKL